jgi:cholesterol transport system auxiliary component
MILNKNNLCFAALIMAVASCGPLVKLGDDGPAPQRFALAYVKSDGPVTIVATSVVPTVRLEDMEAPQELSNDRMVIRAGAQEIQYLKDMRWTEKPGRLLRPLFAEHLKAHLPNAILLSPTQLEPAPNYRLSGRVTAFQVQRDSGKAQVSVEMLLTSAKTRTALAKSFTAEAGADVLSSSDMARGLNIAANSVAQDIANWVASEVK